MIILFYANKIEDNKTINNFPTGYKRGEEPSPPRTCGSWLFVHIPLPPQLLPLALPGVLTRYYSLWRLIQEWQTRVQLRKSLLSGSDAPNVASATPNWSILVYVTPNWNPVPITDIPVETWEDTWVIWYCRIRVILLISERFQLKALSLW